jgi:polar amino acid transport system permease protein
VTATAPVTADVPTVVPVRHWGRWAAAVVVLAALVLLVVGVAGNSAIDLPVVRHYLFNRLILQGVRKTILLAVVAQAVGIVLGIVFAVMRQSTNPVLSGISWLYIWFFRGTPLLIQLVFWANFGFLYSHLVVGIPFTHVHAATFSTNSVLTNSVAAYVGLSTNEGAYMAEVVRGGLISVPEGQTEAALSLGMRRGLLLRRVVLPQAVRVIIPPTGNEFISMIKNTSLVAFISGADLFTKTQDIYDNNLKVIPLLVVASLWYLVITSVLGVGQYYLERRYARGASRALPDTPVQRLTAAVRAAVALRRTRTGLSR